MASGLHARWAMETRRACSTERMRPLPERDALSVIDPSRMGGALIPTVSPAEPTVDQGMPETRAPS